MSGKKIFAFSITVTAFGFALLLLPLFFATPAHAQATAQVVDNGTCINCHEDLYFLHDTGNYFCIRESPMRCVDCHGGNPAATTQETAHYDRSAHPVINEDISKCQECHGEECYDHAASFDQIAGLKEVKPVSPVPASSIPNQTIGLPVFDEQEPVNWALTFELLPIVVITSLALTIYILHKVRH
jgi:hypothetical protein